MLNYRLNFAFLFLLFAVVMVFGFVRPAHAQDWESSEGKRNIKRELETLNRIGADIAKRNVNIPAIVGKVLNMVLFVSGIVALFIFIYGGVQWMVALGRGEGESAKKGMNIITWAVIGIVVIFVSYIAVNYILQTLSKAAQT